MLIETGNPTSPRKAACLRLPHASLRRMMHSLLHQWHFSVSEVPCDNCLELSASPQPGPGDRLTVNSPATRAANLHFPLKIDQLWTAVESPFHSFPRAHIRLPIEVPVSLAVHGSLIQTSTCSLSDRGMRFYATRELVREETLEVELMLEDEIFRLNGTVIYSILQGGRWEAGIVFSQISAEQRQKVREFIIRNLFSRVKDDVGEDCFLHGRDFFDLPQPG